jgi:hypothetical protein
MKFTIILLLSVALSGVTFAQKNSFTPVNMEAVKAATKDYAKLLNRYNAFDTTLTIDDHRILYYGAVYQPGYSPDPELKQKEINAAITKRDFANVVVLCDEVLKKYPISLTANFAKGLALVSANANDTVYSNYMNRYANLLRTIASSGNGKTAKTGFKTIFIADEYEMIYKYFGIKQHFAQRVEGICDVFDVQPSDKWPDKKIYFDAEEIFKKEAELFKK